MITWWIGLLLLLLAVLPEQWNPFLNALPAPHLWEEAPGRAWARRSRWLGRVFLVLLGFALLVHAWAPGLEATLALYLQAGLLCSAWLVSFLLLGLALWLPRRYR